MLDVKYVFYIFLAPTFYIIYYLLSNSLIVNLLYIRYFIKLLLMCQKYLVLMFKPNKLWQLRFEVLHFKIVIQ